MPHNFSTRLREMQLAIPSMRIERRFTLWRHIQKSRRYIRHCLAHDIQPVIVYSHPKTASRSIEHSLQKTSSIYPIHTHVLQQEHFTWSDFRKTPLNNKGIAPDSQPQQWAIQKEIIKMGKPLKTISLVRDPVAVSVSWFFFGLQRWLGFQHKIDPGKLDFEELCSFFMNSFNHDGMLNWFDEEWNKTIGINIFDSSFNQNMGHSTYTQGSNSAIVISTHISDAEKSKALSDFLEMDIPPVTKENTGLSRLSPKVYDQLKESMKMNERLVKRLLESRYATFFFSKEQIEQFETNWSDS